MTMQPQNDFTPLVENDALYKSLKTSYATAVKSNAELFVWRRQQLYTQYAKYLLEYVDYQRVQRKFKIFDLSVKRWKKINSNLG